MPPDDAITGSGQVKLSDIYDEFTGTHSSQEIQLSDYHDKGNAPASGEIQLATDFYGTSNTPAWLGDRGIATGHIMQGGSQWLNRSIHYRSISGSSNTADFGDLTVDAYGMGGVQGGGKAVWWGGKDNGGSGTNFNYDNPNQYYVTVASTGNASFGSDMPDISDSGNNWHGWFFNNQSGGSNGTTGIINPAQRRLDYGSGITYNNNMLFYHTISSTGACTWGGGLATSYDNKSGAGGTSYAFWSGGSASHNQIDYLAYSSPSNSASDWGDGIDALTLVKSCGDANRIVTWGGYDAAASPNNSPYANAMEYFSTTNSGNASQFGNPIGIYCNSNSSYFGKYSGHTLSNGTRGEMWAGMAYTGYSGQNGCNYLGNLNVDYITIQSTGNAADSGYNFTDIESSGGTYTGHESCGLSGN